MAESVQPVPEGRHTVSPYLIVPDGERILTFMRDAFDAELVERHDSPEGRVMHAEVCIGDSVVMLGEASEEWSGFKAMVHLYLPDVDAVFARAVAAGGRVVREVATQEYGDRTGGLEDPAGNQWWIATRVTELERASRGVQAPVREFFPCLCIDGAAEAIEFYCRIFGAEVGLVMHGGEGEDRTIAHAEVAVGPTTIMISDPYPEIGVHPPAHWGGTPVRFHLHVSDVDGIAEAAVKGGATVLRGPQTEEHGERQCLLRDPWGHHWLLGDG